MTPSPRHSRGHGLYYRCKYNRFYRLDFLLTFIFNLVAIALAVHKQIDLNGISTCLGLFFALEVRELCSYLHFLCNSFLRVFFNTQTY